LYLNEKEAFPPELLFTLGLSQPVGQWFKQLLPRDGQCQCTSYVDLATAEIKLDTLGSTALAVFRVK
jgi:hypothetical protein